MGEKGYCVECRIGGQWVTEVVRDDGTTVLLCSYHEQIERELEVVC